MFNKIYTNVAKKDKIHTAMNLCKIDNMKRIRKNTNKTKSKTCLVQA